jgi:undecaprenyl-diphosphatase
VNVLEALLLGVVQGVSEFLPISSSGHLVLCQTLLKVRLEGVTLEVTVHLATLVAILFFYRRRLLSLFRGVFLGGESPAERKESLRYVGLLAMGTVPAAAVGLGLRGPLSRALESPHLAAVLLVLTGLFLLTTRWIPGDRKVPLGPVRAVVVGCAQAVAILPGVSRSGFTVGAGLWSGMERERTAEFSFLLAVPAIAGAGLLTALDMRPADLRILPLAVAFLASLVTGYLSLVFLVRVIQRGRLFWFGPYCIAAGSAAFLVLVLT